MFLLREDWLCLPPIEMNQADGLNGRRLQERSGEMNGIYDGIIRIMSKISDMLNRICCVIVVVVGLVMTGCLVWGVFTRFILRDPAIFTEEVARFCLIWLAFIGSSIAMKRKELTSFRTLVDRLPEKGQEVMGIVGTILLITYVVIFLKSGNDAMRIFMKTKASVTKIPLVYPAMGLYIGACVMGVHALTQLLVQIRDFAEKYVGKGGKTV